MEGRDQPSLSPYIAHSDWTTTLRVLRGMHDIISPRTLVGGAPFEYLINSLGRWG